MKDISILACFGINTDELENYQIEDLSPTAISLSVTKRKILVSCPYCGDANPHIKDYKSKHYFYRNINGYDVKVFYRQRRYFCPSCKRTFLEKNPFVNNSNYLLSAAKIYVILERLKEVLSIAQVADYSGVSPSSVIRVLDKYFVAPVKKLPKFLCIDEFMAFNSDSDFKYACLLLNFINGQVINVIRSRKKKHLYSYFFHLPKEERANVEVLIMDMYKPYKDLADHYLPNATVVIDPFHFVRYTVKAIDLVRIKIMKKYKDDSVQYKMLQKYKKLLLKKKEPNIEKRKKVAILNNIYKNEQEILEILFSYSKTLKKAYEIGHAFLANYEKPNYEGFKTFMKTTISIYRNSKIKYFMEVAETYSNWFKEICNSRLFEQDGRHLSNGPIEGTNNKIKALKRVSYGLTNFEHLKKRIFLLFSDRDPIK